MSRTQFRNALAEVPLAVAAPEGVPIERAGSAREIADKVRQGKALLKIVSTPWGVDFYVVEVGPIQ